MSITIRGKKGRRTAPRVRSRGPRYGPFTRPVDDDVPLAKSLTVTVHDLSALFFNVPLEVGGSEVNEAAVADHYSGATARWYRLAFMQSTWALPDAGDVAYLTGIGLNADLSTIATGLSTGGINQFSSTRDPFSTSDVNYAYPDLSVLSYRQEPVTWRLPKNESTNYGLTLGLGSLAVPLGPDSSSWKDIASAIARYNAAVAKPGTSEEIEALRLEVLESSSFLTETWFKTSIVGPPAYIANFDHLWRIDAIPNGSEWPSDGTTDHRSWWINHGIATVKTDTNRFSLQSENIYYESFDTADLTNFKVTKEATYSSDEEAIPTARKVAKVQLVPKFWTCTVDFTSRDFPGPADTNQTIVLTIQALTVPPALFEVYEYQQGDAPPDGTGGFNGFATPPKLRNTPIVAGSTSETDALWVGHALGRSVIFSNLLGKRLENNVEAPSGRGYDGRLTVVTAPAQEGKLVAAIQVNGDENRYYVWQRVASVEDVITVINNTPFTAQRNSGFLSILPGPRP